MNNNVKSVLTIDEAAEYMGLKKSYLYKLTSERRIPHFKPNGKKIYFESITLLGLSESGQLRRMTNCMA